MNKKGTNKFTLFIRILSYLFLAFLFLIACFLIFYIVTSAIAKKNGTRPIISMYTIVSPSMEPTIMTYDVIIDKRVDKDEDLNVGDIITFYSNAIDTGGYTVTHRVLKKYAYNNIIYYETKGDNNNAQDVGRITFGDIVGKYMFRLRGLGRIQFFVSSKLGWLLIILIPATIIILGDILKLVKAWEIKKNINKIESNPTTNKEEKEKEKKYRALIEKADKMNKK